MPRSAPHQRWSKIERLIALGRDREAVLAVTGRGQPTHRSTQPERGGAMDGVQQLDEIMPLLEKLVDGITPADLDAPTPCAKFTVRGVLDHMIGGATAFAPAFRGDAASADAARADGDVREQWRRAMTDLLAAVHTDGAMDRTIAAPFGQVPGSVFARFVAFDGLVHGWDLAVALREPYAPPDDVVSAVDAFARSALGPDLRDGDTFAAEQPVPADATALERLVAFSGRSLPE